ncbi:NPC intracellular cholesterol transporter 2 homolog a [Ixodes scapularis]|uniref:NPC intracellular cholesterol transporter 2 homolog a n=1 Tax=Ixodes scapularis TaxID=6945 RepID=UPI001C3931E6|nr:NPC intracellular cholesterol transporter 2 homolog a [Ixodes scapularis]
MVIPEMFIETDVELTFRVFTLRNSTERCLFHDVSLFRETAQAGTRTLEKCWLLSATHSFLKVQTSVKEGGEALQVRVDPCEQLPCSFKKGRSVKIEMDFASSKNQSQVSVGIMGKAGGMLLPLPFNQKDGCKGSGLDCPLVAGRNYTVSRAVRVYRIYPKMEILAVFEIRGNDGEVLACVQFPVHIQ